MKTTMTRTSSGECQEVAEWKGNSYCHNILRVVCRLFVVSTIKKWFLCKIVIFHFSYGMLWNIRGGYEIVERGYYIYHDPTDYLCPISEKNSILGIFLKGMSPWNDVHPGLMSPWTSGTLE